MQCPNCQMNVREGSQFCIYCGTQFSGIQTKQPQVSTNACPKCNAPIAAGAQFCTNCGEQLNGGQVQAPTVPQPVQSVEPVVKETIDYDKYLNAYFNHRYTDVAKSNFSIGTFLFSFWWLLIYKLYEAAIKMFIVLVASGVVANIVIKVIALSGSRSILIILIPLVTNIVISVIYAQNFSRLRIEKASTDIERILRSTSNEEERIKKCRAAGKINYIILIIVLLPVLLVLLSFFGIFSFASGPASSIEKSRLDTFKDTAIMYVREVKNTVLANELNCGVPINDAEPGIYYYSFTTANGDSATKLTTFGGKTPWKNGDVSGQVYIYKHLTEDNKTKYEYGLVFADAEGRGFGQFNNSGQAIKIVSETSMYNSKRDGSKSDNRKHFYELTSVGTSQALNIAPGSNAFWDERRLSDLTSSGTTRIVKAPVACEINK